MKLTHAELLKTRLPRSRRKPLVFSVDYLARLEPTMPYYDIYLWEDLRRNTALLEKLKTLLSPSSPLPEIITPPKNVKSVAVHVRKGGGYDMPLYSTQIFDNRQLIGLPEHNYSLHMPKDVRDCKHQDIFRPLKSLPEQYYIDQINFLLTSFPQEKFFIYLFTDASNPAQIAKKIHSYLIDPKRVTFESRKGEHSHDKNVLEDLFSMMNFDILIRTNSSYSDLAHLVSDYELIIYPIKSRWIGNCLVWEEVVCERSLDDFSIRKQHFHTDQFGKITKITLSAFTHPGSIFELPRD